MNRDEDDDDATSPLFTCEICGEDRFDEAAMRWHLQRSHAEVGVITCPFLCGVTAVDAAEMGRHVNVHLEETSPTKDPLPLPSSSSSTAMLAATASTTGSSGRTVEDRDCPLCGATSFHDEDAFLRHVDSHFNENQREKEEEKEGINGHVDDNVRRGENKQQQQQRPQQQQQRRKLPNQRVNGVATSSTSSHFLTSSASDVELGISATSGIMGALRALTSSSTTTTTTKNDNIETRLCTGDVLHIATMATEDRGWGCGYRNTQMVLSSLRHDPTFSSMLFFFGGGGKDASDAADGRLPSIRRLQTLVENAWARGFDIQGRDQLGGRLVGSKKWIGATEIVAMFSSLGVKTTLVDFHEPTGGTDGRHQHPALFAWVKDYFRRRSHPHPLYLQHQGHSRTIVGIDEKRDGSTRLLIFDPSFAPTRMRRFLSSMPNVSSASNAVSSAAASASTNASTASPTQLLDLVRHTPAALGHRQYQIVAIEGIIESEAERAASKTVRSLRIP